MSRLSFFLGHGRRRPLESGAPLPGRCFPALLEGRNAMRAFRLAVVAGLVLSAPVQGAEGEAKKWLTGRWAAPAAEKTPVPEASPVGKPRAKAKAKAKTKARPKGAAAKKQAEE